MANALPGNNVASEIRSFQVDNSYPIVNIIYPVNGSSYSQIELTLNWSYTETNLDSCWFNLNQNSSNTTLADCTLNYTNITAVDLAWNNITLWMNDSAGNINESTITFQVQVDNTDPTIWNVSLSSTVILGNASIEISVNASDESNISMVWISISKPEGVENQTLNYSGGQLYNTTFTNTTHPGVYNVSVYANDSLGNINSSNISFTVAPCIVNLDCGVDGYVGGTYCHSHDIYKLYRTYICSDAGTATSSCSHSDGDSLITDCRENYIIYGSNYCSQNNVVRDATLIIRNCDSSTVSCYSEIGGVNTELVEECGVNYTCVNGSCVSGGVTTTTTTSSTTSTTTSSTTTSSTTSTTIPCELPGDYPPCGEVILAEVMDYIILWSEGEAELEDVINLINVWGG